MVSDARPNVNTVATYQSVASTVVAEREDGASGLGRTLATLASLIDVVAEVDDIVVLVLAGSIAVRIEVAIGCGGQHGLHSRNRQTPPESQLTEVAAREDGKAQLGDIVVLLRRRLGAADGRLVAGAAHGELVPVLGEGLEALGLDLQK